MCIITIPYVKEYLRGHVDETKLFRMLRIDVTSRPSIRLDITFYYNALFTTANRIQRNQSFLEA